jgi:hypothetical protein
MCYTRHKYMYVYTYCKTLSRTRTVRVHQIYYQLIYFRTQLHTPRTCTCTVQRTVLSYRKSVRASTRARNAYVYSTRIHATQYTATHSVVLSYFRGTRLQRTTTLLQQYTAGDNLQKIRHYTYCTCTVSKYCTRLPKKKVNK